MFQPLILSLRGLVRTPAYSAVAITTIAIASAGTLLVFCMLNVLIFRPLPFRAAHELFSLVNVAPGADGSSDSIPAGPLEYLRWSEDRELGVAGAYQSRPFTMTGSGLPERVTGGAVSAGWFQTLSTAPRLGRAFTAAEEAAGVLVAVISESLNRRLFAEASGIAQQITLDGRSYLIVGIMPAGFGAELNAGDVWIPLNLTAANRGSPGTRNLTVIARARGKTAGALNSVLDRTAADLARESPGSNRDVTAAAVPLQAWLGRAQRTPVWAIAVAVALLLLLACVNVASLSVARTFSRHGELAVRQALGATRWRAASGFIMEAATVGVLGAAVGVGLARALLPHLLDLYPGATGLIAGARFELRVTALAVMVALLTAALSAGATALITMRVSPGHTMADTGLRAAGSRRTRRVRELLLVAQIAVAVVLLGASGATLREIHRIMNRPLGFAADTLVSVQFSLPRERYPDAVARHAFNSALLNRVRARAGIRSATVTSHTFLPDGSPQTSFIIEGRTMAGEASYAAQLMRVEFDYLKTIGVTLLNGRDFDRFDRNDTQPVVLINKAMADALFPGQDPLGQRIQRVGGAVTIPAMTIVGVTADVYDSGPAQPVVPTMYLPFSQSSSPSINLLVRAQGSTGPLLEALRTDVWAVDGNLAIDRTTQVSALMGQSFAEQRFRTLLLSLFATFGLLLAGVGIYGVTSFTAAQRSREFGIRMAMGCKPPQIVALVCRTTLRLLAIGGCLGLTLSGLATLVARQTAVGVITFDVGGSLMSLAVITVAALVASAIPSARASRVNPVTALSAP